MTKDIIYKPLINVDVVNVQKLIFKFGYGWDINGRENEILFNNILDCDYFLFSIKDNNKYIYRYDSASKYTPEQVIKDNLMYNGGDYTYFDDYNKLVCYLNKSKVDYNSPRKLIYENKILKFNEYKNNK